MSKPEHSPLPWDVRRALKPVDGEYDCAITSSDGPHAECFGRTSETCRPNAEANAQFIITACNSYYDNQAAIAELVEALEYAQDSIHKTYCEDACEVVEAECCSDCIHLQTLIAKHKAGE